MHKYLKKARERIGRNAVEITIKMKTFVRKSLMIKIRVISTNFYKIQGKFNKNPLIIAILSNNECNILFFSE